MDNEEMNFYGEKDNYKEEPKRKEEPENKNNLLFAFIKAIEANTQAVSQLIAQVQLNLQYQKNTDFAKFENVGKNDVNVLSWIDPDTKAGAYASNTTDVTNEAISVSEATSAALALFFNEILTQMGLINVGVQ